MVGFIKNSLIIILLIFFAKSIYACDYPVKVTNGTECTGMLITDKQFIEVSNNKKKLRLQDLKIAEYKGMEEIYDMRHKHYVSELKTAKKQLKWMEFKSNVGYVISFSLGAVVTGYIAKEVLK